MSRKVVFVGLGTRRRLERGSVRNRGSLLPTQHSGLISMLPTPMLHSLPWTQRELLKLSSASCPPPNPSRTGWLYESQKKMTPCSLVLSPPVPQHDWEDCHPVILSSHISLFQPLAHSQRNGSEGMMALCLRCNLGFLTLFSPSFPEPEALRGTMALTRAILLPDVGSPDLPTLGPQFWFNSFIFPSWGWSRWHNGAWASSQVSWDGEPKHKAALPKGAHTEMLLFIFKNNGKAQWDGKTPFRYSTLQPQISSPFLVGILIPSIYY